MLNPCNHKFHQNSFRRFVCITISSVELQLCIDVHPDPRASGRALYNTLQAQKQHETKLMGIRRRFYDTLTGERCKLTLPPEGTPKTFTDTVAKPAAPTPSLLTPAQVSL